MISMFFKYFKISALVIFVTVGNKIHATALPLPKYEILIDKIIESFTREIVDEFDLICIGSGGSMPTNIRSVSVQFVAYRKGLIEEARKIEVAATEKLAKMINENEEIRPYLNEYPFKTDKIEIEVSFNKPDNSSYTGGSVAHMFQVKNTIFYYAEDPLSHKSFLLAKEPYDEALKIVKAKLNKGETK